MCDSDSITNSATAKSDGPLGPERRDDMATRKERHEMPNMKAGSSEQFSERRRQGRGFGWPNSRPAGKEVKASHGNDEGGLPAAQKQFPPEQSDAGSTKKGQIKMPYEK